MTWVTRIAVIVIGGVLIRAMWTGLGPPWRWPIMLLRAAGRGLRRMATRIERRICPPPPEPDPFTVLEVQHRLGLIATELRVLEAADADHRYYARAHRIHTRRSAYDQLLAEACALAGVPARHPGPDGRICRNADERFSAEMELAARGWHW